MTSLKFVFFLFLISTHAWATTATGEGTGGGTGVVSSTAQKPKVVGSGSMKSKLPALNLKTSTPDNWLVRMEHKRSQCSAAGGVVVNTAEGPICKFGSAAAPKNACPAGWKAYNTVAAAPIYRATAAKTCTGTNLGGCTGTASPNNCSISAQPFGAVPSANYTCTYKRKAPTTVGTAVALPSPDDEL